MPAFDLERFVAAQAPVIVQVREELRRGRKASHWMWFVFPQLQGLGTSPMAQRYAISGREEALAYLAHPVLGDRLRECCLLLMALPNETDIHAVMGSPDDVKLRSCLTLFDAVAPQERLYAECLERFYGGEPDQRTLAGL
jgi:uncharacterized protein (DUF1810 family)